MNKIYIKNKIISENSKPFFVAEMSGNHNQSLDIAFQIVKEAYKAGADAIKLQSYSAENMTLNVSNPDFVIKDKKSPWYGMKLYDLYKKASTPKSWFEKIYKYAKKIGIICFSSVFDVETIKFLEKIGNPIYKISSFELNHIPLIDAVAKTKKPIIISTGMSTDKEIKLAIDTCKKNNNHKIIILKCTSEYPTKIENCNLSKIDYYKKKFKCLVGISDHTSDYIAPIVGVSKGAVLIEKHFKLSNKIKSVDQSFSLNPSEFKKMILETSKVKKIIGQNKTNFSKSEKLNKAFRRSIFVSKSVRKGETVTKNNVKIIRSDKGLHPREYYSILGKRFKQKILLGKPLKRIYFH